MSGACLIISPVPSVPADQGNAVNLARLNRLLQASGRQVHFVYSALEGLVPGAQAAMAAQWDRVDVVPHTAPLLPAGPQGHDLDDWYTPAVSDHVRALLAERHYDLVVVHYIWMTAVCAVVPEGTPVWLYTHDRFSDRHLMLARAGIAPTWFGVPPAQEARALARCTLVLATQGHEAAWFRSLTDRPVHVLGAPVALCERPARVGEAGLAVGYLGSANPANLHSMAALLAALDSSALAGDPAFRLLLAGPISRHAGFDRPYVRRLGVVNRPEDLHRMVDVIVNPSLGGSGLKIKNVEALAGGMPLVSTSDGMYGLAADHPAMACQNAQQLVDWLERLRDPAELADLTRHSRQIIEAYARAQVANLLALLEAV